MNGHADLFRDVAPCRSLIGIAMRTAPDMHCGLIGGAKGSRTPDLLNAILKTVNALSFLVFPGQSKIRL
jgi:hypothetical protein